MPPATRDRRVLVVEDHALFAESLTLVFGAEGYDVQRLVPAAGDEAAGRLLGAAVRARADVVMLDLDLGRYGDGGSLVRPLTRAGSKVIVVTGNADRALWGGCLLQGARAVFAKHRPLSELLEVVRRVAAREPVLSSEEFHSLTALWFERRAEDEQLRQRLAMLTPREREVLGELMAGHTIREVAARGVVSEATVRTQVRSILGKLRVSTQIGAVGLAHRVGWWPPERRP